MTECVIDDDQMWPCATKGRGTLAVALSAFTLCAQYWNANEQYELGEFRWPSKPNGFVAECTRGGWSSAKEPKWTAEAGVDETVEDGSAQWTLRVPTTVTGIQPITDASVIESSAGITVSTPVISENTKILVDYSGGEVNESYYVRYALMIAGRQVIGTQEVHVADK